MGSSFSKSYACLFVGKVESDFFDSYTGPKPELFKRFIDDCIGCTVMSTRDLHKFIDALGSANPNLKFTHKIDEAEIEFLDITVKLHNNIISTDIFYKDTDAHLYLHPESNHPKHCIRSIPFSQLLRLKRIVSDPQILTKRIEEMKQFFLARGYPPSILHKAHERINHIDRKTLLQRSNTNKSWSIPLILTYSKLNTRIAATVKKNAKLLHIDPSTKQMFSNTIVTAYRNSKSLSDHLIHSKLPDYEPVDKSVGTFNCLRPRCNTCSYVHNTNMIFGPNGRYIKIHDRYSCISEAVVYCISCELCDSLYIGQTCRRLADRITEHLRDIKMNNIDKPVSRHFNSPGHSIKNLKVCILKEVKNTDRRIQFESFIIKDLNTVYPFGMNLDL